MVAVSVISNKNNRVYHKPGCMYAKRIKSDNLNYLSISEAEELNYRECKCCSGFDGDIRVHKEEIEKWENDRKIKFRYDDMTKTMYFETELGFWKAFTKEKSGKYLLYHRNTFEKGMEFEEAKCGEFHRQSDFKKTGSITKIIKYIVAHDRAKATIMEDYRKLPVQTKKQKNYYKSAKRKEKRKAEKRLDNIFAMLEAADPSLRQCSMC